MLSCRSVLYKGSKGKGGGGVEGRGGVRWGGGAILSDILPEVKFAVQQVSSLQGFKEKGWVMVGVGLGWGVLSCLIYCLRSSLLSCI